MILYGIPTCDTCRKARRALEAAGQDVTFRDVRKDPLSEQELTELLDKFGEALVNRRSTTWRGLTDDERSGPAENLLRDYPALMKRPVCRGEGVLTLGWDTKAQASWIS